MTNLVTPWSPWNNPFQEIVDIIDTRVSEFCKRFENGWFEKLIQLWESFYLEKYSVEIKDSEIFKKDFQQCIQWYWDHLMRKIPWDKYEIYDKAKWIRSKYSELFADENLEWPKKAEEVIPETPNLAVRLAKKIQTLVSDLVPKA